ncbi:MAG: T9SS type A sorting domain-containing protein [Rhodothermales bacterium]
MRSLLAALLLSATPVAGSYAHCSLVYPTGGETFLSGSTISLAWQIDIPHNQLNWDLYFSADGGASWEVIAEDLPVTQLLYRWKVPAGDVADARIRIVQDNETVDYESIKTFSIQATATASESDRGLPTRSALHPAFPNPMQSETTIGFTVATAGRVSMDVFDALGKRVETVVDAWHAPGTYAAEWRPDALPSGVYLVRMKVGDFVESRRLVVLR